MFSKCSFTNSLSFCFLDVVSSHRVLRIVVFLVVVQVSPRVGFVSSELVFDLHALTLFGDGGFPQMLVIPGCLLMMRSQKNKMSIGLSMCRFAY